MDVVLEHLDLKFIRIPFKVVFRHASAQRSETDAIWIEARDAGGLCGYGEGCPRAYVTAETLSSAARFVASHRASLLEQVTGMDSLSDWMVRHRSSIDANPAAWCALELALLDLFAKATGVPVEALLGLPVLSGAFHYSAVLGDAAPEAFRKQFLQYRHMEFTDFKIKLSGDLPRDRARMAVFHESGGVRLRVRADANNLWRHADEATAYLKALDFSFAAIEEPLSAHDYAGMARMGGSLGVAIILDESFTRQEQFAALPGDPGNWIINVRVSKMGGLLRTLGIVERAREAGIPIIVGAQVGETSLLTRAALTVADAGRDHLFAQEGAFGNLLLEDDIVEPMLRFGKAGMLAADDFALAGKPGFGLVKKPGAEGLLKTDHP